MSDWDRVEISEVCDLIVDCVNKTAPVVDYATDFKMLRTTNIRNGRVDTSNCRFVTKEVFQKWTRRSELKKGDVLLTREAPIGEVGMVKSDENLFLGQRLMQYRANPKKLDPHFLLYSFLSRDLQHQFGMHEGTGSVVSHIRVGDCFKFKISLPPLPEQKAIAHILGALDEKIELNRKMNQTLEAMAQGLFKSWFVDFDPVIDNAIQAGNPIPEELQARAEKRRHVIAREERPKQSPNVIASNVIASDEGARQSYTSLKSLLHTNPALAAQFPASFVFNETLGKWIPEGWEVKKLSALIKIIGGGTPKTSIEEYWNGNIPWFSVVDAPNDSDVFVIDTEKKVSEEGVINSSTQILREGTTIISARGTVGKCAIVGIPMAMNQSCYGIQNLNEDEDIFTYLLVRQNVSDLQNKSHGSVFSTITRDTFNAIEIVVPTTGKVINVFESSLKYNFEKIKSNLFENMTLIKFRDRLLPELISGRIRVKDLIIN